MVEEDSEDVEDSSVPIIRIEEDMFILVDDVLLLLERAALEPLPPKDVKGPQNPMKPLCNSNLGTRAGPKNTPKSGSTSRSPETPGFAGVRSTRSGPDSSVSDEQLLSAVAGIAAELRRI
ncbi:hypothetical protein RHGRI_037094 [Rhododendron griersonianum]|uniref:Uncharacterized protein n=1 Tax=Rhododendron griersonianum TaxID=479676 RepID=A0AAV6HQG2_9ERIC|nr:hypothetical protein RHGRI_037094 [Rhododendron griersonianum]